MIYEYEIYLKEGIQNLRVIPKIKNGDIEKKKELRVTETLDEGKEIPCRIKILKQSDYQIILSSKEIGEIKTLEFKDFYEALYFALIELEKKGWLMLCICGRIDAHVTSQSRIKTDDFYLGLIDLGKNPFDTDSVMKIEEKNVKAFEYYSGWQIRGDWARQKHCQFSPRSLFDTNKFYF